MQPVLIAGGGIGGLTLAVALSRLGVASRIFEARSRPPAEGAGIQLGPNATRILRELGLEEGLLPFVATPDCIIVNDGVSGRELTRLPLGDWLAARHGAPYWVVHRAHLHDVLRMAAAAEPLITLETGREIAEVEEPDGAGDVTVSFAGGGDASGPVLVGADGLWSRVRRHVDPAFALTYAGVAAARAVIARPGSGGHDGLDARFGERATGIWLAPHAHVVHYPVDGGRQLAIVAIGACPAPTEGWGSAVARDEIANRFATLPLPVRDLLERVDQWRQWALFEATGSRWSRGRTILIGDAAHPVLPYLAQGGVLAIEDAFALAGLLASSAGQPELAIDAYCRLRGSRAAKVQAASKTNGRIYHLEGAAALARNTALSGLPGRFFMRQYDWLYGHGTTH